MNAKLALGLVTLCLAAPLAAQATLQGAPRAPRAKPPASSDTGAHPEAAIAMSLVREVYAYEGGGRDPFLSLLKSGDIIGRLRATAIRPREIVFTVQEFGLERQESLQLAKQEGTP